ncbi:MAG: hypothetical protein M0P77_10790, partial [Firmicutes bacterium]|nr:hypothetical protein [Bacillota bacterium]
MKKIISLLLCLVLLFGVFPVTSLDAATIKVSEEAKALETIGILIGDGHGVTSEYMAKRMDRFTAAISILKLKGLYEEALSYKGKTNFKDINTVSWGEGKNILAYIKANPSIGFIGNEKGEFLPGNYISEKEYYKVLLETLGYRQRVSGKAGDFKWDDTYDFAESVGLKPSYKIDFNIDLLAKATVSALNTKTKSGKVYINILIDEGVIKKAKAITAKLIKEAVKETSDFNLKSVKAVGNTVIELKFDDDINMYEAEDTYNYYINGLTIKDAYYMGNKMVRLVTSSQNSGKLYTLQVGDKKLKFTGVSKVSGSPSIKAIKSEDEETVVVEFDKELDFISAADIDNYYISGVDIEDAVLSGKKVTLTTYGLTPRKQYTLKVTNIKSIDGVLQKSQSKSFTNRPDTVPPTIKEVKAETNQRVVVIFSKGVSAETAEDLYNYTIEGNNTELDIYDAVLFGDDEDRVELETEPQKPGAKYEITIDNIADNTKAGNVMKKAVKKTFTGAREDKTAPQLSKSDVMVLSKYQIQLAFTDSSRLDEDTLLDEGNYEVYKNDKYKTEIYVDSVEKISYVDGKYKLVLEVEELEANTSYTVKAYNISDEFGNILEKDNSITITVKKSDFAASAVKDYKVTKNNEIEIYFTKPLEKKSAEDISNYTISNNIGYPTKSVYKDGKVTLTTGAMVEGRLYKLTINGVYDEADNNIKTSFDFRAVIGDKKTQDDYDKPYITNVTALDKYTVEIKYNEDMGYGGIYTIANISYSSYYNIIPNTLKKIDKNKVL